MIKLLPARLVFALALVLPAFSFAATPVNINQADAATIAKSLDGIGAAKARAIVTWRDANGPFKTVDDLAHVKGIGKSTLARNKDAILLADAAPAPTASPVTAAAVGVAPALKQGDAPTKKVRKGAEKAAATIRQ